MRSPGPLRPALLSLSPCVAQSALSPHLAHLAHREPALLCLPERLHPAVLTGTKLELPERAHGLALLKIPTATGAMVGIAHSFRVVCMSMNALGPCSDLYYNVNVLRQSCVKVCTVRAFLVALVCCKACITER